TKYLFAPCARPTLDFELKTLDHHFVPPVCTNSSTLFHVIACLSTVLINKKLSVSLGGERLLPIPDRFRSGTLENFPIVGEGELVKAWQEPRPTKIDRLHTTLLLHCQRQQSWIKIIAFGLGGRPVTMMDRMSASPGLLRRGSAMSSLLSVTTA
ncbi:MAG: hypothetical protein JWM99_1845, partial [Verrucomicrobiales bacterium]|nr:hypothetical protein [Verrucomicrobiales bacterium]